MRKSAKVPSKRGKKGKRAPIPPIRRLMRRYSWVFAVAVAVMSLAGSWFVSHPWQWISDKCDDWPRFVTMPLRYFGDRTIMLTDGLGWTGHDAVYDFDEPAPSGEVFFAGAPVRISPPAPGKTPPFSWAPPPARPSR